MHPRGSSRTTTFRAWKPASWNDRRRPTIAGTGGMRKLRVPVPGRGKRGGARVIYYYRNTRGRVYLITAYLKNVADTISDEGKKVLKQLAKQLDEEG